MARILLVEDDEALTRRLDWMLTEANHVTRIVRSTEDIEGATEAHEPQVVIFNTEMASGEKRGRIDRLRSSHGGLKVIDVHTHMMRRRGEIDADGYIHKPFEADDLLALIDGVVGEPASGGAAAGRRTGKERGGS